MPGADRRPSQVRLPEAAFGHFGAPESPVPTVGAVKPAPHERAIVKAETLKLRATQVEARELDALELHEITQLVEGPACCLEALKTPRDGNRQTSQVDQAIVSLKPETVQRAPHRQSACHVGGERLAGLGPPAIGQGPLGYHPSSVAG